MKIKFVATGSLYSKIFISPLYYNLRSYYELRGKHNDKISWASPIYDPRLSLEELFVEIEDDKIDILCLSIFIWNKHLMLHLASVVKEKYPNVKVIVGGPDVDAHKNSDFFITYPMIDYVVYGDGEEAFVKLVDAIAGQTNIDEDAVNIVTKEKIYPHRVFKDEEYSQQSYWLNLSNDLIEDTKQFEKEKLSICWEMSRGCPYACSFCDWSSGLHHKVKRRKSNWKEEIDLLASVASEIRVMDANWGIYKEDIEIHKYASSKVFLHARNLPKLNKQAAFNIMQVQYDFYPTSQFAVSLQDLNETVLKNIDRPEIPWDKHKELIENFISKNPGIELIAETIIGLPGQTVETWVETLRKLEEAKFKNIEENIWLLLPNSPAYKKEYQEKFSLRFEELTFIEKTFDSYDELHKAIELGEPGWFKSQTITQTYSCDLSEILTMLLLLYEYNRYFEFKKSKSFAALIPKMLPNIQQFCVDLAYQIKSTKIFGILYNEKLMPINKVQKNFYKG